VEDSLNVQVVKADDIASRRVELAQRDDFESVVELPQGRQVRDLRHRSAAQDPHTESRHHDNTGYRTSMSSAPFTSSAL
jgi:hypothetical protein